MSSKKAHRAPPAAVPAKIKVVAEASKLSQPVLAQAPTEQQEQEVRIVLKITNQSENNTVVDSA